VEKGKKQAQQSSINPTAIKLFISLYFITSLLVIFYAPREDKCSYVITVKTCDLINNKEKNLSTVSQGNTHFPRKQFKPRQKLKIKALAATIDSGESYSVTLKLLSCLKTPFSEENKGR